LIDTLLKQIAFAGVNANEVDLLFNSKGIPHPHFTLGYWTFDTIPVVNLFNRAATLTLNSNVTIFTNATCNNDYPFKNCGGQCSTSACSGLDISIQNQDFKPIALGVPFYVTGNFAGTSGTTAASSLALSSGYCTILNATHALCNATGSTIAPGPLVAQLAHTPTGLNQAVQTVYGRVGYRVTPSMAPKPQHLKIICDPFLLLLAFQTSSVDIGPTKSSLNMTIYGSLFGGSANDVEVKLYQNPGPTQVAVCSVSNLISELSMDIFCALPGNLTGGALNAIVSYPTLGVSSPAFQVRNVLIVGSTHSIALYRIELVLNTLS